MSNDFPQFSLAANQDSHPTTNELYDYYSSTPAKNLSIGERKAIAIHVALCSECTSIGEQIEHNDQVVKRLLTTTGTQKDRDALEKSLVWVRAQLVQSRKQMEQIPTRFVKQSDSPRSFLSDIISFFLPNLNCCRTSEVTLGSESQQAKEATATYNCQALQDIPGLDPELQIFIRKIKQDMYVTLSLKILDLSQVPPDFKVKVSLKRLRKKGDILTEAPFYLTADPPSNTRKLSRVKRDEQWEFTVSREDVE